MFYHTEHYKICPTFSKIVFSKKSSFCFLTAQDRPSFKRKNTLYNCLPKSQSFQVKLKAYLLKLIHLISHWESHRLALVQNSVPENSSCISLLMILKALPISNGHFGWDRGTADKLLISGISNYQQQQTSKEPHPSAIQMCAIVLASRLPKTLKFLHL